jgi:hypothetical protein
VITDGSDGPRTCNPPLKRRVLYPLELRTRRLPKTPVGFEPTNSRSAGERLTDSASASKKCGRGDSNPDSRLGRPLSCRWTTTALKLRARGESRTHAAGLRGRCSSPELHGRIGGPGRIPTCDLMVRSHLLFASELPTRTGYAVGIEPTPLRFTGARSDQPSYAYHKSRDGRIRTSDLSVPNRALSPLNHIPNRRQQWLDEESNSDLSGFNRALSPRLSYPTKWSGYPESNRVHECPRLACGRNTLPRRKTEVGMEGLEPSTPAL